jgi:general secretion pathway protein K
MRPLRWCWRELTRPRGLRPHPRHAGWRGVARPGRRRSRDSQSGVALLVVVSAIMVITVLVSEMNYGARVRLLLAAHQKEEVQAYWLARTGINIYKLVLAGNMALKNSSLSQYGGMFGVNLGDALWQAVPFISTGLMRMLFVAGGDADQLEEEDIREVATTGAVSDEIAEQSREELQTGHFSDKHFLDFSGDFNASIVDEDSKVNLNGFAGRSSAGVLQEELTATTLYGIMSGQELDQWFYDRDIDRWEIIGNAADWVDSDNTRCGLRSGYEDDLYNRLEPSPYLAKNAAFDSKEEIRLVDGWEGEVYDKFEDRITVWGGGRINVNTASREVLFGLLKAFCSGTPSDSHADQILDMMQEQVMFSDFQSEQDFIDYVGTLGCEANEQMKNVISTSSTVFTITSMGVVGDTTVTITAVLDYGSGSGTMKYWRVD